MCYKGSSLSMLSIDYCCVERRGPFWLDNCPSGFFVDGLPKLGSSCGTSIGYRRRRERTAGRGVVTPKKATFCLLDQFMAECHWTSVVALAAHKTESAKIEIFHFLASGWLDRALAAFTKNVDIPERWWGRSDWRELQKIRGTSRALLVCERFKNELGYRYAHPWPIYKRGDMGRVMFHMIHATGHSEAPKLMARAYRNVTFGPAAKAQLSLIDEFSAIGNCYSAGA